MMKRLFLAFIFFYACLISAALAEVGFSVSAKMGGKTVKDGFSVLVKFDISDGSHIYYKTAPDIGMPTTVQLDLPKGFTAGEPIWQKPGKFSQFGQEYLGYGKTATVEIPVSIPKGFEGDAQITAKASWLECNQTCMPGEAKKEITVYIGTYAHSTNSHAKEGSRGAVAPEKQFNSGQYFGKLSAVCLAALIGGMILNLMPCVFPVLGLKILSFAKNAGQDRGKIMAQAMMYTAGIVASFWILAGVLIALKNAGEGLGWGFQLQSPFFVAAMAWLFTAIGLNLFGIFEMGYAVAQTGSKFQFKTSALGPYAAAFFSGVLAVAVASPCTAPFMGTALGAALAEGASAAFTFSVFGFLGLGMALPYIAISAFPAVAKMLPKPGAWMETFKQILSFPMFAAVIWLAYVFLLQTSEGALAGLLLSLLFLSFALFLFGKFFTPQSGAKTKIVAGAFSIIALAGALYLSVGAAETKPEVKTGTQSNAWSEEKQDKLLKEGKIVYVDFTASWCLTCQTNKAAIYSDAAKRAFERTGAVLLVGDWTNRSEEISAQLKRFGRAGVPLNLVYSPSDPNNPQVLPALLTPEIVAEAIDKAAR